ncbi:hypothetical protein EST38_g5495 [Candolleomyces aberdarensis]|uniref:F-box domain-containing protein n=1 Tax=Candolleomyces aberdarensis TaxID=2316362 RepID=A0A4Q2DN26_9AGAR|nr:hypothetical protein EST38_g5495 [Candolleomyces aberdarensis]
MEYQIMGKTATLRNEEPQATIVDGREFPMEGVEMFTSDIAPKAKDNASLVNKLPIELLLEIFWRYVHGEDICPVPSHAYKIPTSCQSSGDPVRVSQVCSLWRAIAFSSPTLWSTIYFNTTVRSHFDRLSHHIHRSAAVPLTLTIDMQRIRRPKLFQPGAMQKALQSALAQLPRCRRLYLNFSWEMQTWLVQNLPPTPPLQLEEFSAYIPGWSSGSRSTLKLCTYLHSSPRLLAAKWKGVHAFGRTTELLVQHIPRDVRVVEMEDFHSLDDLVPFLKGCERLERLSSYISKATRLQSPALRLDHLQSLSLSTMGNLAATLGSLTLPSLTELTLDHFWDMGHAGVLHADIGWAALLAMVERSGCRIQRLTYKRNGGNNGEDPYVAEEDLLHTLESPLFDSLTYLSLEGSFGNATLMGLTLLPGHRKTLPGLKSLEVKGCWSTDGVWSELVMSRSGQALESAHILLRGPSQSNFSRDMMLVLPSVDVHAEWRELDHKTGLALG